MKTVKSNSAIIDIQKGQEVIAKHLENQPVSEFLTRAPEDQGPPISTQAAMALFAFLQAMKKTYPELITDDWSKVSFEVRKTGSEYWSVSGIVITDVENKL